MDEDRQIFIWTKCAEFGLPKVKADLSIDPIGRADALFAYADRPYVAAWVFFEESRLQGEKDRRTINAMEISAKAAKWSAIFSAVSSAAALVTVIVFLWKTFS